MPDLGRTVRKLARRVAGVRDATAADPGFPGAATGNRAVAVTESLVADAAGLGGSWPADAAVAAFGHETGRGDGNLLHRPLVAAGGPGARAALSTAMGMALGGLRSTAFVSGTDLAANLDLLADAAGRQVPMVIHVADRADARSAGTGHGPWLAAATTGAVQLHAASVQEAVDLTLVARRVAEEALVPVLVGMDAETATGTENLFLPGRSTVERFLGSPDDTVHAVTTAQEMLWGRHRRRLPRWHDPSRPLTGGALRDPLHGPAAGAARRAYLDPAVVDCLERAYATWATLTGRRHAALHTHRTEGARVLLVTLGATGPTLRAVVDALAGGGVAGMVGELLGQRRPGVATLSALRPLPAAGLAEAAQGKDLVVVLERSDIALDTDGALSREVRAALSHLAARHRPEVATVIHGVGGAPVRAGELAALCRVAAGDPADLLGSPRVLGVELHPETGPWPKRQVVLDALRRAYPDAARHGLPASRDDASVAARVRPDSAWTVAFLRPGGAGQGVLADAASMIHRLAGGRMVAREAPGWGAFSATPADRLTWAAGTGEKDGAPLADPGSDVPVELAVWLGGTVPPGAESLAGLAAGAALLVERPETGWKRIPAPEVVRAAGEGTLKLYAVPAVDEAPALRHERRLGALIGVLAAEGRLEVKMRRLVEVRRETLGSRDELDEAAVERHVAALQAGFDRVHGVAKAELVAAAHTPGTSAPAADEALREVPASVRAAARRTGDVAPGSPRSVVPHTQGLDSLPRFWDQVAAPAGEGGEAPVLPDPHLASGALPPLTASLATTAGRREMLPAFDPAACTGCGACWTVCPDGAIAPVILSAADLVDRGMTLASASGASVDALRMAASKLAGNLESKLADAGSGSLGQLLDAAWERTTAKMKLPEGRKEAVESAFAAVRDALAPLPVAHVAPFDGKVFALAVDADACKGCGLCVAACEPDALTAVADEPRRSRRARKLWQLVDGMPAPDAGTVEAARSHPDVGPLAGALLTAAARGLLSGGDADEAGSGESLAVRQALGATAFHLAPRRRDLVERVDAAAESLAEAIQGGLSRALPGRDLEALSRGLAGLDRPEAELADLTARIETAFESERVDVPRLRHLVDAAREVADLKWRLTSGPVGHGRSLLSVVAGPGPVATWAGSFPSAPFAVPVTVAAAGDAAAVARGVLEGQLEQAVEAARVLRRAQMELDAGRASGPNAERKLEAELATLERLTWRSLDDDERRLAPPVVLVASEDALIASSLPGVLATLADDLPLKVLLLAEAHLGVGEPAVHPRLDAGLLAAGAGWLHGAGALVAQSSVAHGAHLEAAVAEALAFDGPALVRVHAPSPRRHGFAADATLDRARGAVASRTFPLFVSRPAGEGSEGRRLDLSGNPDPDRPFAGPTPADWAAGEARFATAFRPLRPKDGELVPVADFLDLERDDREGRVPMVEVAGPNGGEPRRLRVTSQLLAACEERRAAWGSLQALAAGTRSAAGGDAAASPAVVDAARAAAELDALRDRHRTELDALRADHERQLATLRGDVRVELAQKVRGKLLALALRPRNGADVTEPPTSSPPPTSPGEPAPTPMSPEEPAPGRRLEGRAPEAENKPDAPTSEATP